MEATRDRVIKIGHIVFFLISAAIVAIARYNLFDDHPLIGFGFVTIAILLLVYLSQYYSIIATIGCCWLLIGTLYASYQAQVVPNSLITYDQHVLWQILDTALETGYVEPFNDGLRGASRARLIPGLHFFITIFSQITSLSSHLTMKVTPLMILLLFPVIGSVLTNPHPRFGALIWTAPLFYISPIATVSEQLFALPLFGTILYICLRYQAGKWILIGAVVLLTMAISHSYTPVIALICLLSLSLSNNPNRQRVGSVLILYTLIFVFWIIYSQNMLFLLSGVRLLFLDLSSYISGLSPADARVSFPQPLHWWFGQYIRYLPFLFIGLVFLGDRLWSAHTWKERIEEIRSPGAITVAVGGVAGFAFPVILNAGGLQRGWIIATLLLPLAVGLVLDPDEGDSVNAVHWLIAGAIAILLTVLRALLRGDAHHVSEFIIVAAVIGCLGLGGFIISKSSPSWNPSMSRQTAASAVICLLLVGTLFIGGTTQSFSAESRETARTEVGLPMYHTQTEYTTSEFASSYIDGAVVGDRRVFILEEFYRHPYLEDPSCYQKGCDAAAVIWFNTYQQMWQGADQVIVPHQFPNGDENLSSSRNKIYTTGNSSIYR